MKKLWIGSALSPHRNPYGLMVVLAETKEEAIAKARSALEAEQHNYVPAQRYVENILQNLNSIEEAKSDVVLDWSPTENRR